MLANTLVIRQLMRAAVAATSSTAEIWHTYTDKTSKKNPTHRMVSMYFKGDRSDACKALHLLNLRLAELGYTNRAKISTGNYIYLRVIATLS
jgi:hypothetical protein